MNTRSTPRSRRQGDPASDLATGTEWRLRLLDLVLTAAALTLLALPMALARLVGQPLRLARRGRDGQPFFVHRLGMPDSVLGRAMAALGARRWPELFNVWAGEMSWAGPAPQLRRTIRDEPPLTVRPGLFSSAYLRRRTAIDHGDDALSDAEDLAARGVRRHLGLVVRGLLVAMLAEPASDRPPRLCIGDLEIDNLDMAEALARIEALMEVGQGELVCFANPACVNIAARNRGYRRALVRAALVLPDGIGVKIAGDLLGTPLKQNVNGTDLFPRLMDLLARRGARVFLLGGQPGVPDRVARVIGSQWPQIVIAGHRDGYFDAADEGHVAEAIRASRADVLLVARGVPSQELFVDRHSASLGVKVAIGVGGLFDFVSGRVPRAPLWMREIGAEWIYRLLQEPGRMWQRYLVGNLTFLARVLSQRWGLRASKREPATDIDLAAIEGDEALAPIRGVIVATQAADAEIPVAPDEPAALLPAGTCTLVERQVRQLASSGVREIDLIVCDVPERLRAQLGQGERWGVTLTWHLAKDPRRPYGALRSAALERSRRVVIAHADAWVDDDAVQALAARDGVAMYTDSLGQAQWTGWASGPAHLFTAQAPHGDVHDLRWRVLRSPARRLMLGAHRCVAPIDAAGLLRLQVLATGAASGPSLPGSWITTSWGAHSPDAHVDAGALLQGPVLIGSGCVVEPGASLGPNTWLGPNVIVSAGSRLRDALVLPGTYIGTGLDLEQMIVSGRRVRSLRHGVETTLSAQDGVLKDVRAATGARPGGTGRLAAAVALGLLTPLVGPWLAVHRLRRGHMPWSRVRAVVGRDPGTGALRTDPVVSGPHAGTRGARLLAAWAALGDVASGRRAWFGVRPRSASQWYALNAEWQHLLLKRPIGLLHEPAWYAAESQRLDAEAAADVFYATRAGWRENLRVLGGSLHRLVTARGAGHASLRPVQPWNPTP